MFSWPVAALLIALLFRKFINKFLEDVSSAKIGPLELQRRVEGLEALSRQNEEITEKLILIENARIRSDEDYEKLATSIGEAMVRLSQLIDDTQPKDAEADNDVEPTEKTIILKSAVSEVGGEKFVERSRAPRTQISYSETVDVGEAKRISNEFLRLVDQEDLKRTLDQINNNRSVIRQQLDLIRGHLAKPSKQGR